MNMKNPKIKPSDDLSIAETVLLDAANAIRNRHTEHGHTERSFGMIGELWGIYMHHSMTVRSSPNLLPEDIAQMMVLLKIARAVYGNSVDNFTDGAGYMALAAMLSPQPESNVHSMAEGAE
jgi:hypothetical protein